MRQIVLDTETTGLDPFQGHRVVEIGCVELINRIPTGSVFHAYVNPERDVPTEAEAIHGLGAAFLSDKPLFTEVAGDLVAFLGDAKLVMHNAAFDLAFLNAELDRVGKPPLPRERVVDTLVLARRRHPAGPNRLDDLCARYGIDASRRVRHGALLDAELLAEVYAELVGGRQARLVLDETAAVARAAAAQPQARTRMTPVAPRITEAERRAHLAFVSELGANAVWREYLLETELAAAS
jgi:DNA polymerase-3 subunit epsilon